MRIPAGAIGLLVVGLAGLPARAGGPAPALGGDVLPLLKARCVKCHGPGVRKGGLNLSTPGALARGGKGGPAVVAGRPEESPLWARVADDEMPPKAPLSAAEKEVLRRWIGAGAAGLPAPRGTPAGADHWAFAPFARPAVPAPGAPGWARTEIDRFVLARLDAGGLSPAPEADRRTLIRRVTFDLTGLPPTPEEVDAFEADRGPGAYERVVDRLLASPAYGERWGKFWLDAAGYADSNGYFSADSERPLAYRYRDYVVRAVNADLPFDQFVREQLAGDELAGFRPGGEATPETAGRLAATHYLRNGQDGTGESDGNPDEVRADRFAVLEGAVQIVGASLLGLTLQCARCHDHKFEPVTQKDYYALQAVLAPAFPAAQADRWAKPADRVVAAPVPGERDRWKAGMAAVDREVAALDREFRGWCARAREPGVVRFRDGFDAPLAGRWRSSSSGLGPIHLDSAEAPGAAVAGGALRVVADGAPSGRRLVTAESFDWTPEGEGNWVEVTFRLAAAGLDTSAPAERVGYYVAARDDLPSRGNLLIDGDPGGGAQVHAGYPGPGSRGLGKVGRAGYAAGRRYGVRVTNAGGGKFRLEHVADGATEGPAVEVPADDLPDGGFGFEYCTGRSFAVDDVLVEAGDAKLDPVARRVLAARREARRVEFEKATAAANQRRAPEPGRIAWVTDLVPDPPPFRLLNRGDYGAPGPEVAPAPPGFLSDADNPYVPTPAGSGPKTTGRRRALARWLTRPGSRPAALLARVTVNRVWQHHFGAGLVATPENLGVSGSAPSHPELLEHLAAEFAGSGWSQKALHRRIVGSAVYRQSGTPAAASSTATGADPDGRWLSFFPLRRLDAEALRDAMLAVSGELDPTPFGPAVPARRGPGGEVVVDGSDPGACRRSVYLRQRRTELVSLLEVFDAPSIVTSCSRRPSSTVPLQSLSLLNSGFVADRARAFAARVAREAGPDPGARLARAFRLADGRPPEADEAAAALRFLATQPGRYPDLNAADAEARAWADLCQMVLAGNAFLYLD